MFAIRPAASFRIIICNMSWQEVASENIFWDDSGAVRVDGLSYPVGRHRTGSGGASILPENPNGSVKIFLTFPPAPRGQGISPVFTIFLCGMEFFRQSVFYWHLLWNLWLARNLFRCFQFSKIFVLNFSAFPMASTFSLEISQLSWKSVRIKNPAKKK